MDASSKYTVRSHAAEFDASVLFDTYIFNFQRVLASSVRLCKEIMCKLFGLDDRACRVKTWMRRATIYVNRCLQGDQCFPHFNGQINIVFTTRLRVGIFLFSAPDIYHLFQ